MRISQKVSNKVLFKLSPFLLSSQIVLFALRQDEHLPVPERHHIPAINLRRRIAFIETCWFTWSAVFLLSSFCFILLHFFSLFSCYVPFPRLNKITFSIFTYRVTRWSIRLTHCATNRKIPNVVIILPTDLASNRNEHQVYFLGVKAAGA